MRRVFGEEMRVAFSQTLHEHTCGRCGDVFQCRQGSNCESDFQDCEDCDEQLYKETL